MRMLADVWVGDAFLLVVFTFGVPEHRAGGRQGKAHHCSHFTDDPRSLRRFSVTEAAQRDVSEPTL